MILETEFLENFIVCNINNMPVIKNSSNFRQLFAAVFVVVELKPNWMEINEGQ